MHASDDSCSTCTEVGVETRHNFTELIDRLKRLSPDLVLFYSVSNLEPQPETFHFIAHDIISTVSKIRHPSIRVDSLMNDATLHTVIRIFGAARGSLDKENHSVTRNVNGFLPHFYVLPNEGWALVIAKLLMINLPDKESKITFMYHYLRLSKTSGIPLNYLVNRPKSSVIEYMKMFHTKWNQKKTVRHSNDEDGNVPMKMSRGTKVVVGL